MVPTVVVNIKKGSYIRQARYVYIGRPSIWGNPFTHLKFLKHNGLIIVATPAEACQAYRDWLFGIRYNYLEQQRRLKIMQHIKDLEGKIIGCYCVPDPCHGNVLVDLLENGFDIEIKGVRYFRKAKAAEVAHAD